VLSSVENVIEALRHREVVSVPRGELFLGRDFLNRHFPDLAGNYPDQLLAAARRLSLAAVGIDLNIESSKGDLEAERFGTLEEFFGIGCIDGPFSHLVRARGFVGAMIASKKDPQLFAAIVDRQLGEMEISVELASKNRLRAVALADDIAGKNGLLFSPQYFGETILPAYRMMAAMIKAQGLFAFIHSDGDMGSAIRFLAEAGFDCIHPVDMQGGLSLRELTAQFRENISFMGHVDLIAWDEKRILEEVTSAEEQYRGTGGLILGSAGGISLEVPDEALAALYPLIGKGESRE
jgi:hypothetical protein